MIFFFILIIVCCVFSLESPRCGDSNENTQHALMLEKLEKISLLCLLSWRYDKHSLARSTPVSNIFSWSQRCSSHRSSAVLLHILQSDTNPHTALQILQLCDFNCDCLVPARIFISLSQLLKPKHLAG